jgi:glycosyltransferase involved in cell wall biosynthesis
VTSLLELAEDGALLFDPLSVGSLADALEKMAVDANLRVNLRDRGFARLKDFDWEHAAKLYRAVYRRAAHDMMTEEDEYILNSSVKN